VPGPYALVSLCPEAQLGVLKIFGGVFEGEL